MGAVLANGVVEFIFRFVRQHHRPISGFFVTEHPTGIVFALEDENALLGDIEHIDFGRFAVLFRDIHIAKHLTVTPEQLYPFQFALGQFFAASAQPIRIKDLVKQNIK